MRHTAHLLAPTALALALGCGTNGQEPAPAPAPQGGQSQTEDQALRDQFVAPHEREARPVIDLVEVDGACRKAAPVGPEYTAKGRSVQWRILNGCTSGQTIQLTNWRIKGTNEPDYPFNQPQSQASCTVAPGRFCVITLTARPRGPGGGDGVWVYLYDIVNADGTVLDPEIIIEWF